MISSEFAEKLQSFPNLLNSFSGIYSSNNLPRNIKKNSFVICNTDVSEGKGKHWYCVLKLEALTLELFDSLGIDNNKKAFIQQNFRLRNVQKIHFNVTQVQSSMTDSCGYFVLYFLINRFYNKDLPFNDLLNEIFVASHEKNENLVQKFKEDHF